MTDVLMPTWVIKNWVADVINEFTDEQKIELVNIIIWYLHYGDNYIKELEDVDDVVITALRMMQSWEVFSD